MPPTPPKGADEPGLLLAPAPRLPDNLMDQPRPALALYGKMRVGPHVVTAISRTWHPGDVARCGLCSECCAVGDTCLILVRRDLDARDVTMHMAHGGWTNVDGGPRGPAVGKR